MIKVKRLDCPEILKKGVIPASDGEVETLDTIVFFTDVANHKLTYQKMGERGSRIKDSFTVYSDKQIRKQLIKMFHGKCAYCESKVSTIYSGDIEHFRPKAGYGASKPITRPGYFWLASDWDNLLFACPFCNQNNTHEIAENGTIVEVVLGKQNQFPLKDEHYRLLYNHGLMFFNDTPNYINAYNLEESVRLLLKPCTDNVEDFFKYEEDGRILPSDALQPIDEERANTSITVYALKRIGLIQSREEKIIQIKAQIRRVEEAMINLSIHINDSNEIQSWYEGILNKEMRILLEYKEPNKEYAGLARYVIDKYFTMLA